MLRGVVNRVHFITLNQPEFSLSPIGADLNKYSAQETDTDLADEYVSILE